ncbi:hyaluronidase-1 isoform X1 [Neoarius graeffei]|uniref:hyaluronidase-1 isoform X1 n=1 Tax=Neoarius graeffei TaxID=443677 RepID=UPI00298C1F87|nr:hyaluronidase-1 isoform X1 [Neoarius graeffei]
MWRSSSSTPSSPRVIMLLTLSLREHPATLRRKLISAASGMGTIAHWTCCLIFLCIFLTCPIMSRQLKLLSEFPFFTVWNAPTEKCASRYGVDLDLSVFNIIHNQNQSFNGSNITIFYSDKLGFYPHYTEKNESVYGGIPQNFSLHDHLSQAFDDLQNQIPDKNFSGLAVVDWESWRPLWERNWNRKNVYQQGSRALVRAKHASWKPEQIEAQAKKDFEGAAQAFMEQTIKLGRDKRPGGLWGFYGFPCCYNYQYKKNETYTGECVTIEVKRNDELSWLWNISTALYPDLYMDLMLKGHDRDILLYAQHRILEAMRVREQVSPVQPVVIPYARIVYTYSMTFLSQEDLVHTIGESVALGAAGIVLWGDALYSTNKSTCLAVKNYLDETLGRYVVNVTKAAFLCSKELCSFNGRCVRRDPGSSAYLHLDPAVWTIISRAELPELNPNSPSYLIQMNNKFSINKRYHFTKPFKCQCYPGWEGEHCEKLVPNPSERK